MRSANIYYNLVLAGVLVETDDGDFVFTHEEEYVKKYSNQFISCTMQVRTGYIVL